MKLLAIIPARGGSKGISRKNIKPLAGKPLIGWTIDQAMQANSIDRLIVSTEDEEIASVARQMGVDVPFMRPAALAEDDTPGIFPVLHALEHLPDYDWVLLLQPTSPLRTAEDIEGIVKLCLSSPESTSAVSICHVDKHPYWMYSKDASGTLYPLIPDRPEITRRQELPDAYALNGALYLARTDWLIRNRSFLGKETLGYLMPQERSIDLDTPLDWQLAEYFINNKRN
ncbi:N-acylneuraminate cytidylyltransferase [Ectothiorhodospira magna]|uniref:N-acylneuraminate cytidylyltransferase n=1 Tax=Ectothiorhodospira magna TaxID=867345 RepID=A0A1H9A239_9GAMM|nr:acylneuraminate cytidylyltransferase family protein [Ectothiorhodospira magna]SEP70685.1 N-acylneuraminate cytidylyltransferase [Ectothiorhodospira magna]